jgi:hypothetical protein
VALRLVLPGWAAALIVGGLPFPVAGLKQNLQVLKH